MSPQRRQPSAKGRNLLDSQVKSTKGRINQVRPKSEKFRSTASIKTTESSSANIIQKNLDDYLYNLSNFELKQKLESCPGNLGDCPLLNEFRKGLKKSISNHVNLTSKNDFRLCKTSRNHSSAEKKDRNIENIKMSKQKSNESAGKKRIVKDVKSTSSNTSRGVIRSTRAQDLRSQSNRDLLKPKTTNEKTRTTSPYVPVSTQKKKKTSSLANAETKTTNKSQTAISSDDKKKQAKTLNKNFKNIKKEKKEKSSSAGEDMSLQRQKTQEIINPKIVKKTASILSTPKTAAGDCEPQLLKKSQTFFICKGAKGGEGGDDLKKPVDSNLWTTQNDSLSEENATDDDSPSPKPKPLTHNDSFCLIVKSSQNWSQKNRSDDEKWLRYGLAYEDKTKKTNDKGILKNSNYDLKSVDSLEKVDSEKIVRFSDELIRNKKVLKKLVRRKKRLQNFLTPNWYQKNKLFQKYLQILREKSVLLSDTNDTPDDLKPFRVPIHVKERHEAEMFGLYPRKGKTVKNLTKDAYSY